MYFSQLKTVRDSRIYYFILWKQGKLNDGSDKTHIASNCEGGWEYSTRSNKMPFKLELIY